MRALRNAPIYAAMGVITALYVLDTLVHEGWAEWRDWGFSVALHTVPRVVRHEVRELWSRVE